MKRRTFLQTIPLWVPSFLAAAEKKLEEQAPSDRLRLGCIGLGPMGRGDATLFGKLTDIVALCDLDSQYGLAPAMKIPAITHRVVNGLDTERKIDTCQDYRRILERDDIDAVSIATPDHWHIKIAIEAMQAGKHVFCQKPLTLTIEENLLIRKAVQKYGKVFQVGTQQRAQRNEFMTAALMVRQGMLGKIRRTTCFIGTGRKSGVIPQVDAPATLDWNIWLGQAPLKPYRWTNDTSFFSASNAGQGRGHLLFRWWFEYSGGRITDWGAHHIDCALWILGRQTPELGPVSVESSGVTFVVPYKDGYPVRDDMYNTPYDYHIVAKFDDDSELVVTSDTGQNGVLIEGTQGRVFVNRGKITGKLIEEKAHHALTDEQYVALYHGKPLESHKANFLRCIREGGTPVSDVASNVVGMHVCHLANISCRLGRKIYWDGKHEKIVRDEKAAAFMAREQRKGFELPQLN